MFNIFDFLPLSATFFFGLLSVFVEKKKYPI